MIRALYLISTRRADVMGQFANGRLTTIAAMVATCDCGSVATQCGSDPADAWRGDPWFVSNSSRLEFTDNAQLIGCGIASDYQI